MHNLWADFDHEQSPAASSGQGHTRRLTEQVVLSSLRDWLLHDYVASYCRSLTANPLYRRCYWIDALGVAGKTRSAAPVADPVEPEGTRKKGRKKEPARLLPAVLRPVAALAGELAGESRPIALYGIALEAGSSRRKDARSPKTELAPIPKEGGLVRASWLEVAPALFQTLDQFPAICLLNPFGQTLFSYEDLEPLYQRMAPTELCLLISHKQVEMRLLAAQRAPATASTLVALLRSDRWKTLLPKDDPAAALPQAVSGIIDYLLASMQRQFLTVQRITFPAQVRPAVVEETPYTLVFATRRADSLINMNDAVCLYQRRLREQSHQGVLGEDWFATQQRERFAEGLLQLYRRTLNLGQSKRPRRWPDLRQQLLIASFGQFTRADYDEIICRLLRDGEVRCEWRRVPPQGAEDDGPRLPGNDDTLIWR